MSTKEIPQRLTPTKETLNRLFAFSGNVCAFPGCDHPVFDEEFELVAQVCHIEAAMPDGERFNKRSNNEDRRKLENLMALCLRHHVKTNNVDKYRAADLREMKRVHESQFTEKERKKAVPQMAIDKAYEQEKRISEQILQTVTVTEAKVDQILEISKQMTAYMTVNPPGTDNSTFGSEIDTILSLRSSHNQKAAIVMLSQFREKNWTSITAHEKYRVVANMGICYLEIGKEVQAADLFLEALEHQPELLKAIGLASLGYAIKGDQVNTRLMIEKALKSDSLNVDAYQALIHSLSDEGKTLDQIIAQVPEEIRQSEEIAFALGFVAREQGNYHDAITWLQIGLDNTEGSKANATANLASVILQSIDITSFLLNGTVDQHSKNKANLALQYFNEALEETNSGELQELRSQWMVNRGVAKKFLGDRQGAFENMQAANALWDDFTTSRHLAIAAMELGAQDRMWEAIGKMGQQAANEDDKQQIKLFIAEIDINEGRKEKGITVLESLLENGLTGNSADYVNNKLVQLYAVMGRTDDAAKLIGDLIKKQPDSARPYITQTQFFLISKNEDEALKSMEEARSRVSQKTPPGEIYALAELYGNIEDFKKAADLLEMIADIGVYSSLTRQLLFAYFNAGETGKLIKVCNDLLNTFGPRDMVTELLSWAYEGMNDLKSAIRVLTEYLSQYPDDQLIQARLAFIYYRQIDKEPLKNLLKTIDHIDTTLPLEVQYKLAKMFHYIGDEESFRRFAYGIRRDFYEEVRAHDAFISLSVMPNQKNNGSDIHDFVTSESAVTVKVNETTVIYTMELSEPVFGSRGEISPKHQIGAALLGKTIGEKVIVDQSGLSQEFTILHIVDKFNYAVSESMQLLSTKFVASAKTKKIVLPHKADGSLDFDVFFEPLRQIQKSDAEIEALYKKQQLPIGMVSVLKQISPIRSWANYIASSELGVFTSGPLQELIIAERLIKNSKPLVLDILAITTLSSLDALDDLLFLPNERIVTNSTLEELYDLIHEQELSSQTGSLTVGIVDGQYVKQVLSPANVQAQIKQLQDLANWVKSNCTVVPTTASLKLNAFEKQELDNRFGKSFIDSVLTAKEKDALLYSEEMPMRSVAYVEYQVKGCATFMILRVLKEKKYIDPEKYKKKVLHLIEMNYKFIPVESDVLHQAAVNSKFTTGFPFDLALEGLTAPLVLPGFEIVEAVKFIYKLYAEKLTVILSADNPDHIETLTNATLDQLSKIFPAPELEEGLTRGIDRIFQFIPIHQKQIRTIVRHYFTRF